MTWQKKRGLQLPYIFKEENKGQNILPSKTSENAANTFQIRNGENKLETGLSRLTSHIGGRTDYKHIPSR